MAADQDPNLETLTNSRKSSRTTFSRISISDIMILQVRDRQGKLGFPYQTIIKSRACRRAIKQRKQLIRSEQHLLVSTSVTCPLRHTLSDTENQIPIVKTYSRARVQARKHFFISSPARWGPNTFT